MTTRWVKINDVKSDWNIQTNGFLSLLTCKYRKQSSAPVTLSSHNTAEQRVQIHLHFYLMLLAGSVDHYILLRMYFLKSLMFTIHPLKEKKISIPPANTGELLFIISAKTKDNCCYGCHHGDPLKRTKLNHKGSLPLSRSELLQLCPWLAFHVNSGFSKCALHSQSGWILLYFLNSHPHNYYSC